MAQQFSSSYTIAFAAGVCLACSLFVAGAAVALKDRQEENKVVDRQKKVLEVAGLIKPGERLDAAQVKERFDAAIVPRLVDATGNYVDGDAAAVDWAKAMKDASCVPLETPHPSKVKCVPEQRLVYEVVDRGQLAQVIVPVEGKGLWSTLYGYIALEPDGNTINGIIFYQHGETPGLGGEVDNPRWRALWKGRRLYKDGVPTISVTKGAAGPASADPYHVDGLSGATLTSRGVTHLVQFWTGPEAFGPYLENVAAGTLTPPSGKTGGKAGGKAGGKPAKSAKPKAGKPASKPGAATPAHGKTGKDG